jgi:hypothetical membrane protein
LVRWCSISAILGTLIFIICTACAIRTFGGYNFNCQYLSELALKPTSGVFFNTGCILGSILIFPFFLIFPIKHPGYTYNSSIFKCGLVACISLCGLGIFDIKEEMAHVIFHVSFVISIHFVILHICMLLMQSNMKVPAVMGIMVIATNSLTLLRGEIFSQKIGAALVVSWITAVVAIYLAEDIAENYRKYVEAREVIWRVKYLQRKKNLGLV